MAWVMAKGHDIVAIPGTKRRKYLEDNVQAASILLSASDLARLESNAPVGVTLGDRYPDMSTVNR